MVSNRKSDVPLSLLIFIYLLSVLVIYFNQTFKWHSTTNYTFNFFSINIYVAKSLNIIFLLVNIFFIRTIFTNRDRKISGDITSFVYALIHNKIWFLNTLNNYLISDFFILLILYILNPKDQKQKINLLIFYLACFFGLGFLSGINIFYSFFIPIVLFNLFLITDMKSWIIFFLGFLLPVYFFVSISWLLDYDPLLYLQIILENSLYKLSQFTFTDFKFSGEFQWINFGVIVLIGLIFIAGLKEWSEVNFYSTNERRMALFFFLLMFFSLVNYLLIHIFYHQQALSVIALPFAYYLGNLLNKMYSKTRYFILLLLFILTVFL